MDQKDWPLIKDLFQRALGMSGPERDSFLSSNALSGDVVAEVRALLYADETAGTFLQDPAPLDVLMTPDMVVESMPTRIGPYRVIREIGRGGMGSVYLGARADGTFEQSVALKLAQHGPGSTRMLNRFRQERNIVAALHHPNIARLFDGGATEDGRPFFAMEYVEGTPITTYCDGRRLTITDRLRVFQTVCEAVQFAHSNLVVHRDLKPSNILVSNEGSVKLLDFGIAKLMTDEVDDASDPRTQTGFRLMTPEYAAPEQIRGERITTATDVYQLGVLLYELLTGRRPFRLSERLPHEIERVILDEEPIKPSTSIGRIEMKIGDGEGEQITPEEIGMSRSTPSDKLRKHLHGDLDTIVLTALQKDPVRRYKSVQAFADDVSRHLDGLTVSARPDTLGYRLSKFVRRHTIGVAASIAVAVALFTGFGIALWQAEVASGERDRARQEAARADFINTFILEMLSAADPNQEGREVKVVDLLGPAAERAGEELAHDPEVESSVRRTLGLTYQNLGLYEEAGSQLRRALVIRERELGRDHPLTVQSTKDMALLYHWTGVLDTAETLYRSAIDGHGRLAASNIDYAEAMNDYATLLIDLGRYAEAESLSTEALEITTALAGNRSDPMVAVNLINIALARHWRGDTEGADSLYREALQIQYDVTGPDHLDVAHTLNNLGWVHLDQNDLIGADSLFRASLAIRKRHLGEGHPSVALALGNLAIPIALRRGDYDRADSLLHEALRINRAAVPGPHPYTANLLAGLGVLRREQGRLGDSEEALRDALEMRRQLFSNDNPAVGVTELELATTLQANGNADAARPLLLSASKNLQLAGHHRATEAERLLARLDSVLRR